VTLLISDKISKSEKVTKACFIMKTWAILQKCIMIQMYMHPITELQIHEAKADRFERGNR
jgi:hypothetical protein